MVSGPKAEELLKAIGKRVKEREQTEKITDVRPKETENTTDVDAKKNRNKILKAERLLVTAMEPSQLVLCQARR